MSEISIITGRILTYGEENQRHNLSILNSYSYENKSMLFFSKNMFNENMLNGKDSYCITFGRSYKNVEASINKWIDELEDILLELRFDSVGVFLETDFFGTHQLMWFNKEYQKGLIYGVSKKREIPDGFNELSNWYFGKGFHGSWGNIKENSWINSNNR